LAEKTTGIQWRVSSVAVWVGVGVGVEVRLAESVGVALGIGVDVGVEEVVNAGVGDSVRAGVLVAAAFVVVGCRVSSIAQTVTGGPRVRAVGMGEAARSADPSAPRKFVAANKKPLTSAADNASETACCESGPPEERILSPKNQCD
jgi:hypothetical protein